MNCTKVSSNAGSNLFNKEYQSVSEVKWRSYAVSKLCNVGSFLKQRVSNAITGY